MTATKGSDEACRRCSDCRGAEHHWMDNYDARDEPDPQFACKHCPTVGDECAICGGEGGRTSDDGYPLALCPQCNGHGVIARPVGSRACACPRRDARNCIRWRSKDDMREHLGAPTLCSDDDECECSCHDDDDDNWSDEDERP